MTNTQSWNRFSYVSNNPINYADPTGHMEDGACGLGNDSCGTGYNQSDFDNYMTEAAGTSNYCEVYPNVSGCGGIRSNGDGNHPGNIDEDISEELNVDPNNKVAEWQGCLPECDDLQAIANSVGNITQDLSTLLSGIGTLLELGFTVTGCVEGGPPGCAAGFILGNALYTPINFFESGFGGISTFFTVASDALSGDTNFTLTQSGISGQIGGGTRAALITQGIGAVNSIATVDFILDVISSVYNRKDTKNPSQFNLNW